MEKRGIREGTIKGKSGKSKGMEDNKEEREGQERIREGEIGNRKSN